MEQADAGSGASGGGGGGGEGAATGNVSDPAATASAVSATATAVTGAADSSLLAQGQSATALPIHEAVPEKFRVFQGEGEAATFDMEASLRKVSQSYADLEKHRGTVPKNPEEYAPKIDVEGFDFEAFKADPTTNEFLKGAHAKGMTNEQVSYVLDRYMRTAPELVQAAQMLDDKFCATELRKTWPDDKAFKDNLGGAYRAFEGFANKAGITLADAEASGLANNPVFLRLMASVAPEMGEDPGVHPGDTNVTQQETIAELMASEAYRNPKDPKHAEVSQRVKSFYEKNYPGLAI
jgi:hypothetical protein